MGWGKISTFGPVPGGITVGCPSFSDPGGIKFGVGMGIFS
jgi:hypothetical protein